MNKETPSEPQSKEFESREAIERELDEAIEESFPASDPPALHIESGPPDRQEGTTK